MKKIISTSVIHISILSLFIYLCSCTPSANRDAERAMGVFFLGVLQVINIIIFGVGAVIFSVLSATNVKPIFKVLGWMFLSLFTLFVLIGLINVLELNPKHFDVFIIFFMEAAMIIVSLIFVIRKPVPQKSTNSKDQYLEKIISEEQEVI